MKNQEQIKSHRETIYQLQREIHEKHDQIEDLCTELTKLQISPTFKYGDLVVWNNSDRPNQTRVGEITLRRATPSGWDYTIQTHTLHWKEGQERWITKVIEEKDLHIARGWTRKDLIPKRFRPTTRKTASSQEKTREPTISNEASEELWTQFLTEVNN